VDKAFEKWWAGSCQHLYGKHAAWEAWEAAQPQWQPIETARKDDTIIATDGELVREVYYYETKGWFYFCDCGFVRYMNATQWQPKPQPPKQEEDNG